MTYISCKKCASRRDCWIWGVIECRTRVAPSSSSFELVLQASRGECPLYNDKDEPTEEY